MKKKPNTIAILATRTPAVALLFLPLKNHTTPRALVTNSSALALQPQGEPAGWLWFIASQMEHWGPLGRPKPRGTSSPRDCAGCASHSAPAPQQTNQLDQLSIPEPGLATAVLCCSAVHGAGVHIFQAPPSTRQRQPTNPTCQAPPGCAFARPIKQQCNRNSSIYCC